MQDHEEEDALTLLSEAEALELVEFDHSQDTWEDPSVITAFLEKHLRRKGRKDHYGSEKTLYT